MCVCIYTAIVRHICHTALCTCVRERVFVCVYSNSNADWAVGITSHTRCVPCECCMYVYSMYV